MAIELENSGFNLVASALGGFLLLFGALSYLIKERLYLGEAPLAVIVGIILERSGSIPSDLGGKPGGASDPLDEVALSLSRLVIGIQLVLVGIQLPQKYPLVEFKSLAILLLPVMASMWLTTTGLVMLCFPGVPLLVGLVIASCATPTDPVLSNSIIKGSFADQHVSPRLRNLISAESGANDGFGYPFLFLAVHLIKSASTGEALKAWVLETILYQVVGAAVFGALVGFVANQVLKWSTNHNYIDKESFLCYGVAVGIFTVGAAGYLNLDDLLAAFAAGNALTWDDWYRKETEEDELQNVIDLLLNTSYFIFVGATIPWKSFNSPDDGITVLRLVGLGALVLLLRRLPALLLFHRLVPCLQKSWSEALFMGYFGPIGAGAIFYASLVAEEFKKNGEIGHSAAATQIRALVKPITYALVISSLLGHTLMIPALKWFLSWRKIGHIRLMGEEGEHEGSESDAASFYGEGDADRREEAYETGENPDEVNHQEDGSSTMTTVPGGKPASLVPPSTSEHHLADGKGVLARDGTWNANPSWRLSSAHVPTSHKLGAHAAAEEQHNHESGGRPLPDQWESRVRDLESGSQSQQRSESQEDRGDQSRPSINDHRRQSVI
ncbi:hypothetical protein CBS101457_005480 [Exobasidium rhododendri]|nr:hypothetical protein CBS101457_005480 [Exobasidium rhododendri]